MYVCPVRTRARDGNAVMRQRYTAYSPKMALKHLSRCPVATSHNIKVLSTLAQERYLSSGDSGMLSTSAVSIASVCLNVASLLSPSDGCKVLSDPDRGTGPRSTPILFVQPETPA